MYTKQEISKQKQEFWTAFGGYMKPVLSADGERVSWVNYKTGVKQVSFKMDVSSREAFIAIVVDGQERDVCFDKLVGLKGVFEETMGESDWTWRRDVTDEYGKVVGVVEKRLAGVNIFKREDWPEIISFLKARVMALDEFWSMVRYGFDG